MTLESFTETFSPLVEKWQTHFTPHVAEQIYYIVRNTPESGFKKLVADLVWLSPYKPPTIDEFLKYSRENTPKLNPIKTNFCKKCGYGGVVSCLDGEGTVWVYRCSCEHSNDVPLELKLEGGQRVPFKSWESVKHLYKLIPPINRTLQVFTDEERRENFKLLHDVLNKRITKEEMHQRLEVIERAIAIAQEGA